MSARANAWIVSGDTGVSSKNIWAHMMGVGAIDDIGGGFPHDPDDFGRCYRLLKLIPEWRPRIGEMACYTCKWSGGWPALVAHWGELETLWERIGCTSYEDRLVRWDRQASKAMYDRMKEIMGEIPATPPAPSRRSDQGAR